MKQLSALTASLFLGLSLSFSGEATTWEKYPGIQGPGIAGMVIGDFDGNGTPEALVTGSAGNGATHFLAVLSQDSTGELGIRTITTVPRRIVAPVILAPQSDGSDFLAVITGDINNSTTNQILILGGIPLRVLRTIEAPLVQRISSIADVDGDGQLDIVVLTYLDSSSWQYYPAILDYQTGNVSWVSTHQAGDVGVA